MSTIINRKDSLFDPYLRNTSVALDEVVPMKETNG